jgi:hypothetical protein
MEAFHILPCPFCQDEIAGSFRNRFIPAIRLLKNNLLGRLFKNAQMQGAQKPKSEAYIEIRRAMRLAAQRSR